MSFSPEQLAILALTLLVGLCLGYLAGSGGNWKRRYREIEAERRDLRAERDAAIKDRDLRIEAANTRIAELERGNGATIGAGTAAAIGAGVRGVDDLTAIRGIDRDREVTLNEAGYARYRDIAKIGPNDVVALEGRLGLRPGTIAAERWVEQADALSRGKIAV